MAELYTPDEADLRIAGARGCWTLNDLWRIFGNAQPDPVVEPEEPETPERVLRREAAEMGVRVLDFRGRKRNQPHPFRSHCVVRNGEVLDLKASEVLGTDEDFGIWGWFGGGKNKPSRGKAHGKLKWEKCSTTVLHTMDVEAGPARCVGMPVQDCIAEDGTIVLCHSIVARCYAAHDANAFSDSLEVSGKRGMIREHQVGTARALFKYVIASKRRHTDRQLYVIPHALSHWSRVGDCALPIWDVLGEWGISELGLKLGPVVGSGEQPEWLPGTPSNR